MESIPLPTSIQIEAGENDRIAKIIIEPFFPGYGTTIGNALRRVLLSSLPGAALTSFSVKGIQHEFSAVPGVKEDFVDIALNLKQVRLKVYADQPVRLHLSVKGERKVTAGDITETSEVKILNPEHVIATLTDKSASLEMDFIAQQGRGYVPTETREKEELEVGMIALDALYSPIRKVGFLVENVRVGQMTNWDKLILEIETDGALTPKEALEMSAKYLIDQMTFVAQPQASAAGATAPEAVEAAAAPEMTGLQDIPSGTDATADASLTEPATKPAKKRGKKATTA
ncbi:MAG: DNA-directed RNA polymerase subunit alpha [Patescibacteria group bacterium]|nr:DNA-directed RNA polymerase subunit alpha [Patescibacteria group bacterium]